MRYLSLLLLGVGCGCPKPLCAQWLSVELSSETWAPGTYAVAVDAGDAELRCTAVVVTGGIAPIPADVDCEQGVLKDSFGYDTAGNVDPDVPELRVVTGYGAEKPATAWVEVVRTVDGVATTLLKGARRLDWAERTGPARLCAVGCAASTLTLAL